MTHSTMSSKFFYSEYFDGNPQTLNWWATSPPMAGRSLVTDFTLHWALRDACNGGNARGLEGAGYCSMRPDLACTFVDNPDTDTSSGEQVISNKLLAYAFILSVEGYPFVYGKDYFSSAVWPGAYGLQPWIDNLVWIHEHLANGGTVTRYLDDHAIVVNRVGQPGLLTALNFDSWSPRKITCATSFGPNAQLHDYTGHHEDIQTDANGFATFTVPANAFSRGQSYLCFSHAGIAGATAIAPRATTQTIFGASDLDTPPARTTPHTVGHITAARDAPITLRIRPDRTGWQANSSMHVALKGPGGQTEIDLVCTSEEAVAQAHASGTGQHAISVVGSNLPANGSAFELDVTYTAPQSI